MNDGNYWDPALRAVVGGRKVILAAAGTVSGYAAARELLAAGASDVLVYSLSARHETDEVLQVVDVEMPTGDSFDGIAKHWEQNTVDPPPHVRAALDAFDPDRSALAFRMLGAEPEQIAGRRVVSRRRPEWEALEDKTEIDAFWQRHGIPHQPAVVVPIAEAGARSAAIDRGAGTVWAADARDGLNGGAAGLRWVRDATQNDAVTAEMRSMCDRVRVMPFLEGIPCSIHGIVLPDGLVALRPVEMIVFRREARFLFAGVSTYWDPPGWLRDEMRDVCRRVGAALRDEVSFRGAFTLDGVATVDGFWPTELNPRVGAGLQAMTAGPDTPPVLLFELAVAALPIGITARELEAHLLEHADEHRVATIFTPQGSADHRHVDRLASYDGATWSWQDDPGTAAVTAKVTISASFMNATFDPSDSLRGHSLGEPAASFLGFADTEFGTSFGSLEVAYDVTGARRPTDS